MQPFNLLGVDRQWNLSIDGRKSNYDLWNSINWKKVKQIVNRLQTRIVKAAKRSKTNTAGCFTVPYQCLSRVRGNSQARFLGGLGLATAPGYLRAE